MKQNEAVICALQEMKGVATLGQLYERAPKIPSSVWATKTPFASIRRIVQFHPEIYKIKRGLYGLKAYRNQIEAKGIIAESEQNKNSEELKLSNHTYYQGLLLTIGKHRNHGSWVPNQDRNKLFLNQTLGECRSFQKIPLFSYAEVVQRSSTIDVIWFNERRMPCGFFEVEHSTDIQNSLLKFNDLQDFYARMVIVSAPERKAEYEKKLHFSAFKEIKARVRFLDYNWLVKEYEHSVEASQREMIL